MPCISDYMEPTEQENYNRHVAKLMLFVRRSLELSVTSKLVKLTKESYAKRDLTPELCELMRKLTTETREALLYGNPRDRTARELATWWEDHVKLDAEREKREATERSKRYTAKVAWRKLSREERIALGLDPDNQPWT